jgi:hypothetical protein
MGVWLIHLGIVGGRFHPWLVAKIQRGVGFAYLGLNFREVLDSPNSVMLYVHARSDGVGDFARLASIICCCW